MGRWLFRKQQAWIKQCLLKQQLDTLERGFLSQRPTATKRSLPTQSPVCPPPPGQCIRPAAAASPCLAVAGLRCELDSLVAELGVGDSASELFFVERISRQEGAVETCDALRIFQRERLSQLESVHSPKMRGNSTRQTRTARHLIMDAKQTFPSPIRMTIAKLKLGEMRRNTGMKCDALLRTATPCCAEKKHLSPTSFAGVGVSCPARK